MPVNPSLKLQEAPVPEQDALKTSAPTFEPLLVSAEVAGPMCGRSEASWWRDHAAERIPAPVRLGGRTLWRVEELRRWVEAGCPGRRTWEFLEKSRRK
jgi:predicted DNA-binding transcriptional regulator AlpA